MRGLQQGKFVNAWCCASPPSNAPGSVAPGTPQREYLATSCDQRGRRRGRGTSSCGGLSHLRSPDTPKCAPPPPLWHLRRLRHPLPGPRVWARGRSSGRPLPGDVRWQGVGAWQERASPPRPPPSPSPPLPVGSRHVVPGVGGGGETFWALGIAPTSSVCLLGAFGSCSAGWAGSRTCIRGRRRGRCGRRQWHLKLFWAVARAPAASAVATAAAATAASDAPARGSGRMWLLGLAATFCGLFWRPGKRNQAGPGCTRRGAHTPLFSPSYFQDAHRGNRTMRRIDYSASYFGGFFGHRAWCLGAHLGNCLSPALLEDRLERAFAGFGVLDGLLYASRNINDAGWESAWVLVMR